MTSSIISHYCVISPGLRLISLYLFIPQAICAGKSLWFGWCAIWSVCLWRNWSVFFYIEVFRFTIKNMMVIPCGVWPLNSAGFSTCHRRSENLPGALKKQLKQCIKHNPLINISLHILYNTSEFHNDIYNSIKFDLLYKLWNLYFLWYFQFANWWFEINYNDLNALNGPMIAQFYFTFNSHYCSI